MYLGGVYELLVSGASDECIAEHLWRIVTERMELSAKKSDMAITVKLSDRFRCQNSK